MIYNHYLNENWNSQGYGRTDQSRRDVSLNGERSFVYTYYQGTERVQTKKAYSDSNFINLVQTYFYNNDATGTAYTYYNDGLMSSVTFTSADANGMLYYQYFHENWNNQGYGRVSRSRRSTPLNNELSYTYTYYQDGTGRLQTKTSYSDSNFVNSIQTYFYNNNATGTAYTHYIDGLISSAILSAPDSSGMIYYHYIYENWNGQGYGRVNQSKRLASLNGELSYNYTYYQDAAGRLETKKAYSDSSLDHLIKTYVYYNDLTNYLSSVTLSSPDSSDMFYYHYLDENWKNQGYGRIDQSRRNTPLNGERSYSYYYTQDATGSLLTKNAYSDANGTTLVRIYTYTYYSNGNLASSTLSAADESGVTYYHYLNENWKNQGFGRVDEQRLSDGTVLKPGSQVTGFIKDQKLFIVGTMGDDFIKIDYDKQSDWQGYIYVEDASGSVNCLFLYYVYPTKNFSQINIYGFNGNDTITATYAVPFPVKMYGGAGNDQLFAQNAASDLLDGGLGEDLLVAINDDEDILIGDDGLDSFWNDDEDAIGDLSFLEITDRAEHAVSEFYQPFTTNPTDPYYIPLTLQGQDLPDPLDSGASLVDLSHYASYPLFNNGMVYYNDIRQGIAGDCYFMASLASVALQQPESILQSITSLGDGTYAVRFYRDGIASYLRIDGQVPGRDLSYGILNLDYARPGATTPHDVWVALLEKAYAFFRTGQNTYASISGGHLNEPFPTLGLSSTNIGLGASDADAFSLFQTYLAAGQAVTLASSGGGPIVASHAYSLRSVDRVNGIMYATVYNPWGSDGGDFWHPWDSNSSDGLLTITISQLRQYFFQAYAGV